jgi:acyl-CoA reductase-like NAD-dependent aldehyde dehydrogenase
MIQLDALGPTGVYHTRNRMSLFDVAGRAVGEMSLVPRLYIQRSLAALRAAAVPSADYRAAALARAGDIFTAAPIGGLSVEEYQYAVSRLSGLPICSVRRATQVIASAARTAYQSAQAGLPAGAVADWRDPMTRGGSAVWTRRGHVLAINAAGNHPAVHALWLQAVALGYRVAVRPSQREPLTPHRLISALIEAGFRGDQLLLLPTDHGGADQLVNDADLAVVYGGDQTMRKYASSTTVLPQGPGRSKILITRDADWRDCLDTVVNSVIGEGGTACLNASAVYVEGDPAPVAEAIAERLSALPSLPPEDEKAVLPVQPIAAAVALERFLHDHRGNARPWLGGEGIIDELGDGSAVLRPAVFQVSTPDAPQTKIELPFPCLWIAPWSAEEGVRPLRNTLALTALTTDEKLIGKLVDEPTVGNVYTGVRATGEPGFGMPHDGYLSEFLMRSKSVVRG